MPDARDTNHPPADPKPTLGRRGFSRATPERPLRWELAAALLLGVVLIGAGLYLWRRPRATAESLAGGAPSSSAAAVEPPGPVIAVVDAGPAPVTISDPRVLGCHDRGTRKTPSDQCDHVSSIEKALTSAVERSAACIEHGARGGPGGGAGGATPASSEDGPTPRASAGGGTIEYVADVSFLRHKVSVILPRAGRSIRDRKALAACATAVRGAMDGLKLDGVAHEHARYRIAVTATYLR